MAWQWQLGASHRNLSFALSLKLALTSSDVLKHAPYIASLPAPDKLRASVYFTPSELSAFKGTNLYGATTDRLSTLREEWSECQLVLTDVDGAWGVGLTWLVSSFHEEQPA